MAKDIKVTFEIEAERTNTEDLCRKLKLDSSYGFFDECEITNDSPNHYEITAYIDEFDIDNTNKFADNFNEYISYIKSISNEFLYCEISYSMCVERSQSYYIERNYDEEEVEVSFNIGFYFEIYEVENFDSIVFSIDNFDYDSDEITLPNEPINNTFKKAFTELENRVYANSSIYTYHWCYESDGSILLTDYIKELECGIYVGDGKDKLIKLRDELNEIINQLD